MTGVKPGNRPRTNGRILATALLGAIAQTVALIPWGFAASASPGAPVEHLRGIYLQQAIEVATVGSRTVYLTRMTRFRRCGQFRGLAEDFNDHLVDVAGTDVSGIGFVAGLVNTTQGCTRRDAPRETRPFPGGARRD